MYFINLVSEKIHDENIESIPKIEKESELFGKSPVPEKVEAEVAPETSQEDSKYSEEQAPAENVTEKSKQSQEEPAKADQRKVERPKQASEKAQEENDEQVITEIAVKVLFKLSRKS